MYYYYEKWKGTRHWAVYSDDGQLQTICLYKKGAIALVRCLLEHQGLAPEQIKYQLDEIEHNYRHKSRYNDSITLVSEC